MFRRFTPYLFAIGLLPFAALFAQPTADSSVTEPPTTVEIIDRRWGEILIDWRETEVTSDLGGWVNNVRWQGRESVRFEWRPGIYPPDTSGDPVHPYRGVLRFSDLPNRRYLIWIDGKRVRPEPNWRTLSEDGLTVNGLPASVGGPDRAELTVEVLIRSYVLH